MFGIQKQVDAYYFGYREVHDLKLNSNVLVMPPFEVVRFLTSKNKAKVNEYFRNVFAEAEVIASGVRDHCAKIPPPESTVNAGVDAFLETLNDDGKKVLSPYRIEIQHAAALGFILGKLDGARVGERPPVAIGIHDEAISKLVEPFVEECQWGVKYCIIKAFFLTRAGVLK